MDHQNGRGGGEDRHQPLVVLGTFIGLFVLAMLSVYILTGRLTSFPVKPATGSARALAAASEAMPSR